jgi:hypothetical protein
MSTQKKSNKIYLAIIPIALVAFIVGAVLMAPAAAQNYNVKGYEPMQYYSDVWVTQMRGDQVVSQQHSHNLVVDQGKDFVKTQISGAINTTAKCLYIALSNNNNSVAPAAGWTNFNTQLTEIAAGNLSRANGTYTTLGNGQWKVAYTFMATGTYGNITFAGLNNDGSLSYADLFAANTFYSVNMISGDTLNITWQITVS